jgi:hypothetical protein
MLLIARHVSLYFDLTILAGLRSSRSFSNESRSLHDQSANLQSVDIAAKKLYLLLISLKDDLIYLILGNFVFIRFIESFFCLWTFFRMIKLPDSSDITSDLVPTNAIEVAVMSSIAVEHGLSPASS